MSMPGLDGILKSAYKNMLRELGDEHILRNVSNCIVRLKRNTVNNILQKILRPTIVLLL